jgi:hypothetical protein
MTSASVTLPHQILRVSEFQKIVAVAILIFNDFWNGSGSYHIALVVGSVLQLKP